MYTSLHNQNLVYSFHFTLPEKIRLWTFTLTFSRNTEVIFGQLLGIIGGQYIGEEGNRLSQCRLNVGPPSTTLAQHWLHIGSLPVLASRRRLANVKPGLSQRLVFAGQGVVSEWSSRGQGAPGWPITLVLLLALYRVTQVHSVGIKYHLFNIENDQNTSLRLSRSGRPNSPK